MSAMRKRKPVEAGDGSYGGAVLAAFDAMQTLLPMGTQHRCKECGSEYLCEVDDCLVGSDEVCPACRKWQLSHSSYALNVARRDPLYAAKLARIDARQRGGSSEKRSNLLQIVQLKTANSGGK